MSVFRRRSSEASSSATPPSSSSPTDSTPPRQQQQQSGQPNQATIAAPTAAAKLPPHVERALITLTTKVQSCIERLDAIEHRLDELADAVINAPSHSDVLEVRLHSAKLAAELARATVELRGEIGMANDEARRESRLARNALDEETAVHMPVDIDLTPGGNTTIELDKPASDTDADGQRSGWSASA